MRVLSLLTLVFLLAGIMLIAGCAGGSTGNVQLLVGDGPIHLDGAAVSAVNVDISKVELLTGDESASGAAFTLFDGSSVVNLLNYANKPIGGLKDLGLSTIPPGTYTQLRLIVNEANSNVVTDSGTYPLQVPSGPQTGLKVIDLNLTIDSGVTQVLYIDFDLSKLHTNNKYLLTPNALRVVKLQDTGSITGTLALPTDGNPPVGDVAATLTLHTAGSTDVIASTFVTLNTTTPTAMYTFHGIPAGTDYVITVDLAYGANPPVSFDLPATVTTGTVTDLGTHTITEIVF